MKRVKKRRRLEPRRAGERVEDFTADEALKVEKDESAAEVAVALEDALEAESEAVGSASDFLKAFRNRNKLDSVMLVNSSSNQKAQVAQERLSVEEVLRRKASKKDASKRPVVLEYEPLNKVLYKEHPEVSELTDVEISELKRGLDLKTRGRNVPRPITKWKQAGLPDEMFKVFDAHEWKDPFPIQRQALPVLMSGRDMIGVAKTGSGKTLAFLIPLFRHILAQRPLIKNKESGPMALILAPARELAIQIHNECKKFASKLGMTTGCVYGGSSLREQISKFKASVHVAVATPGRMIELLGLNSGKLVSLKRCSFVVLDEADRMFDMGFEPQVSRILSLIRPDRQLVMFSATFPESVESLARRNLNKPCEIVVGGRSRASNDVEQFIDVVENEDEKFKVLLRLLGEWTERGQILVFLDSRSRCDDLFQKLLELGYEPCVLHGGVEQVDRDSALRDFKCHLRSVMLATSVAGRGLDVKDLVLVINYDVPNHLEDYVHRVGRTGRAGNKGTAHTFLTPEEKRYAPDLTRALRDAQQEHKIPLKVKEWSDEWKLKVKEGVERFRSSGFTNTKGFTFDAKEIRPDVSIMNEKDFQTYVLRVVKGLAKRFSKELAEEAGGARAEENARASLDAALISTSDVYKAGQAFKLSSQTQTAAEIEINGLPEEVRKRIAHRSSISDIEREVMATITVKGSYIPPNRPASGADRRLYLYVETNDSSQLVRAVDFINEEIRLSAERMSEQAAFQAVHSVGGATRRY